MVIRLCAAGLAACCAGVVTLAQTAWAVDGDVEPNETLASSSRLDPGIVSVSGSIDGPVQPRIAIAGFDPSGNPLDACPLDFGFACTDVNPDGSVHLRVTGLDDPNDTPVFTLGAGDHSQSGGYRVLVHYYDEGYFFLQTVELPGQIVPDQVIAYALTAPDPDAELVDAEAYGTPPGGSDRVDFLTFQVPPGTYDVSITSADMPLMLGIFEHDGDFYVDSDDGLAPYAVTLPAIVPSQGPDAGVIRVGVSHPDDSYPEFFIGNHQATSNLYQLSVQSTAAAVPALPPLWLAALTGALLIAIAIAVRRAAAGR